MRTKVAIYVAILRMGSDFLHRHTCNSTCQSNNISKRNNVGLGEQVDQRTITG